MIKLKNLLIESNLLKLYHGTPNAENIIQTGFDINSKRASDAGDFGWGIYFTNNIHRAKQYGEVVESLIDTTKFAYIENPYFIKGTKTIEPATKEEKLFYNIVFDENGEMLTLHGGNREQISKKIRQEFLKNGYKGIKAGDTFRSKSLEFVVFDDSTIKSAKRLEK